MLDLGNHYSIYKNCFLKVCNFQDTVVVKEKLTSVAAPKVSIVGDPFSPKSQKIVSCDGTQLFSSMDLLETVGNVFCTYFILHIEYAKEVRNTFSFLETISNVCSSNPPLKIVNFMERFRKFKDETN